VSRDPAQEYFADGMTEALISDLARLRQLRVISRTSAMKYKGVHKSLPEIAFELNVDAILEGSALLVGDRVRINVQLVAARRDEMLWNDRYDRDLTDVLSLQSEVAAAVAKEIALRLSTSEAERLAQRQEVNANAHLQFLKGKHTAAEVSPQAIELGLQYFERALQLDPAMRPPGLGSPRCHYTRGSRGMAPPCRSVRASARRSIEGAGNRPILGDAYAVLGGVQAFELYLPDAFARSRRPSSSTRDSRTLTTSWDAFTTVRSAIARPKRPCSGRSNSIRCR
jgi:TolB-like protein